MSDMANVDPMQAALLKQISIVKSLGEEHGDFSSELSQDLSKLGLLYIMSGEYDQALPVLHKRLVIHEKYGPEISIGETLQTLGTAYRLHGQPEIAHSHLTRALEIWKKCHGENSLKVAETLNSLSLLDLSSTTDDATHEDYQVQSLQLLYDISEPEDMDSEDVPWEVFKRLKKQQGPTTAANSLTLLKANLRKCTMQAVSMAPVERQLSASRPLVVERSVSQMGPPTTINTDIVSPTLPNMGMPSNSQHSLTDAIALDTNESIDRELGPDLSQLPDLSALDQALEPHPLDPNPLDTTLPPISDAFATATATRSEDVASEMDDLQKRVEKIKRHVLSGAPTADDEIDELQAHIDSLAGIELKAAGRAMMSLLRELVRMVSGPDKPTANGSLPTLEGILEKKSASIFRGWEKRWFTVDPRTFVLSYYFSRDDQMRGFAPRGGFSLARVTDIQVKDKVPGTSFQFDLLVDLSTRQNPNWSRKYELRCETEDELRYWMTTLHRYKASMGQGTAPRPTTA